MKRRLLNLLTLLSQLLCVAVVALWVRNWGHLAHTQWIRREFTVEVYETDGVLGLLVARDDATSYGWDYWRNDAQPGRDRTSYVTPSFNRWGFGFHVSRTVGPPRGNWRIGGRRLWMAYVPYWLPASLFAMASATFLVRRAKRYRRARSGHCPSCGYDLRATPDRCPECGSDAVGGVA